MVAILVAVAAGYLVGSSSSSTKVTTETVTSSVAPPTGSAPVPTPPASTGSTGTTGPTGTTGAQGTDAGSQAAKGNDAAAKSTAVTAAEATETCAVDNNGSYSNCTLAKIDKVSPDLAAAGNRISLATTSTSYRITVVAEGTAHSFTLDRGTNGAIKRTCKPAGQGGCSATGSW